MVAAAAAAAVSEPVVAARARPRRGANGHLYRIHHHRMLLGVPVLAAIFASGAWLGDWVGGGSSADAATVTVHLKGKIIRVAGAPVAVRVPAQTVHRKGRVISGPGDDRPASGLDGDGHGREHAQSDTVTDSTFITTTLTVPTTVTDTTTDTTTVTETTTISTANSTSAPTT